MLIPNNKYLIYFGNQDNSINPECYKNPQKQEHLDFLDKNIKNFNLKNLIFAKQTHSNIGLITSDKYPANSNWPLTLSEISQKFSIEGETKKLLSWTIESDYIITDLENIGIGVLTADCLPIIIINQDPNNKVAAIIHAGWRGAVNGIIENCLNNLRDNFKVDTADLKAFLGPCAKVCCYEVKQDFIDNLPQEFKKFLAIFNNKFYFNLPKLAQEKLIKLGIKVENIIETNNLCTICSTDFCSVRLDKNCNRQISFVSLKNNKL